MPKIVLAGLDAATALDLSRKLGLLGFETENQPCEAPLLLSADASAIFASDDGVEGSRALARLRREGSLKPFILVSRVAEEEKWLAALSAGATDYCTPGIDVANLRWIVQNALGRQALTCAA